jgi:hypothetical protein
MTEVRVLGREPDAILENKSEDFHDSHHYEGGARACNPNKYLYLYEVLRSVGR